MIKIDIKKLLYGSEAEMELEVNLEIKEHDFVSVSGKSGSGKTTLLRILAGLENAEGEIIVDKEVWQKDKFKLPVQKRKIGFVFQDYALFPNMNVEENLLFVNKDRDLSNYLLEITELSAFKTRDTNMLSGGQKQRVSLCRALMNRPKLLLMDEPLSALDPTIRGKLQSEILTLHKEFGTTTILVSHDISEIYRLSNRQIVLSLGKIVSDIKTKESSKNSSCFGELLDIVKVNTDFVAIISTGEQLVKVAISKDEIKHLSQL